MPSNRTGSVHERSSSFTSSFALIAFTSTLTLFLAHLAARQPQPVLQQPAFQQPQPPPSIAPAPPTQPPPPSVPPPAPPPAPAPSQAPPSSTPIVPPLSHSVPPLQQPTLIWLGNNSSGILYALLVLVLLFGLSGVWLERIAPSPTNSGGRFEGIEVENYSEPSKSKNKKKLQSSTLRSIPSDEEDSEDAKIPGRWMNRMEARLNRMQRKVDKERKQRKSKIQDDPDLSSSSTSSSSSYEGRKRSTYRYHRSSHSRRDHPSCVDHGVRLHKRRDSYCCDHCGTIVAVCAGSGATLDAPPPPIPVLASNIPSETGMEEVTKIKVESTSTISKDEFEKAVNRELERRLRECEKRLEEEVLKRLQKEQEDERKKEEKQCKNNDKKEDNNDKDLTGKWNEAWDNESWERKEEKIITKTETKGERKDEASTSSTKEESENTKSDKSSDESKDVETKKVEVKITVKEKEKEKEKGSEPQILLGILKKPQESSKSSSESDNGKEDNEREEHRILQKLHGFQKGISEMANDLKDEAKETVQDLGEFTQELKDEAKEKAQDVKEKAKDIVHDITHFGSESRTETNNERKSSTSQEVQINQDFVKDQSATKVEEEDDIEHKAAPMEASEIQKSPKSVTFADPIQTEQEIPAITIQPLDKGKGKARQIEEEDHTYSFSEAPMPMPDTVPPYEIDENRFIGVKGSLSSNSSSSETSSGSGEKEKSSKVKEKTRVSITSSEDGNKVISSEKVTTTENTDDDDEKELKDSKASKEADLTELLFQFADKIVDGFKSKSKKSKGKSKKEEDASEVRVDKTPKMEDGIDSIEANDDGKGKDVEENSESTVKITTKISTSEEVKEFTKTESNEDVNTSTKAETKEGTKVTTSEKEDKPKDEVMIVGKADVGQSAFTAEELYLETAKYLSEKYPELVAKETVRINSSLDQTYEEGKGSLEEKKASDANDQAHQDGDEPAEADTAATLPQQDSNSTTTNIEQVTTKAQNGSDSGEVKSIGGEEAMMRALGTIRQYGGGSSYSNLESKYYQSFFRPKVERSADDVLLSLINSLINQPKQSDEKPIKFAASALQGPSKIKEKVKSVNTTKKVYSKEEEVEEDGDEANEEQKSSTSNFPPERISADAIRAASIATADQIRRHQARLHPQDDSFFKFLKKDTAKSFDSMKDEVKDVSSKIGKFTGTLKRKVSKGSLKGSPSSSHEKSRSSFDAPERFDASQVTNIKSQKSIKKIESPTPYGISLKDVSEKALPTPYGLNFNKPPIKKPLVQFDRKVNVLEFHDPSTSSSNSSSNSITKETKQQTSSKTIKTDNIVKASEEEDVYARIAKLSRRLSEK